MQTLVNRINSHRYKKRQANLISESHPDLHALVTLSYNYHRTQRIKTLKIYLLRLLYLPLLSWFFNLTAVFDITALPWRFNVRHNSLQDTRMGLFVRAVADPESLVKYAKCAWRKRWSFSTSNQRRQFANPVNDGLCFHTTSSHLLCMIYCNQRTTGLLLTMFGTLCTWSGEN